MSYFFVTLLQAFLPATLLLSLLWAKQIPFKTSLLMLVTLAGIVAGAWIGSSYPKSQPVQLILVLFQIVSLLFFLVSQRSVNVYLLYLWQTLLMSIAGLRWGKTINSTVLSATDVINTELLLNTAAIVMAAGWVLFCGIMLRNMARELPAWRWPLLLLLTSSLVLPLSGDALLLLIKLQLVALTTLPLSYVALATHSYEWLNYFCTLLLAVMVLCYFLPLRRGYQQLSRITDTITRRKALSAWRHSRRIFYASLLASLAPGGTQLYWDYVASQPLRLSAAIAITVQADSMVHIPLEQVRNGKLHRFVWVAADGKAVRFLVINRYADRLRLSVVFDACLLCGDEGYVMEGNQVVCIACGVQIFIPSIGKQGGCNPIPVEGWKNDDRELLIPQTALEAGINYF